MEVAKLTENDDGSALVELDMSSEELRLLVEYAVVNILKEFVEEKKNVDFKKEIR